MDANQTGSTPADIRSRNRAVILRSLYPDVWRSRAELAKITGISKASISDVVAGLIDDGLIIEGGYRASNRPGKPALLVGFNPAARHIIAIDIADIPLLRGYISDLNGSVIQSRNMQPANGNLPQVDDIIALCEKLIDVATASILGIGIAVPGTVDDAGTVLDASNLHWSSVHLQSVLEQRFNLPVVVLNDADAAALGERYMQHGVRNLLVICISRGVGAGMIIENRLVRGDGFAAGEIGHVVIDPAGPLCSCGRHGCLETLVSAAALRNRISEDPQSRQQILRDAADTLGKSLSMPVSMANLREIAVMGPDDIVDDVFLEELGKTLNGWVRTDDGNPITVRRTKLGQEIVSLGVGAAVLQTQLNIQ